MVFQRRIEFKVIYGAILAGQFIFLAVGSGVDWGQWETVRIYAIVLLAAVLGFLLLNELLGHIRIDNEGIFIKSLFSGRLVKWSDIANIDFWSEIERMNSFFPNKQPALRVALLNGKSLSIHLIYQDTFLQHLQEEAKKRALLPN